MKHLFHPADYIVFGSVLLLSAAVGVICALRDKFLKKRSDTETYLMGGRKMSLLPVAISLLVSFNSGIVLIGAPAEMYTRGFTFWWSCVGIALSALLTCYLFVPVFYGLELTSVYEYLELRFRSAAVRKIGSSLYIFVTIVYLAMAIYAPSVALSAVTGVPLWILNIASGAVCTFYVSIGGIKAVVWTDVIQAGFMLAGILAVAIQGTIKAGGIHRVLDVSIQAGRLNVFNFELSPFVYMSTPGIVFGQLFSWLGWYGINQSSVQRYCGMRTVRQGQQALLLNIPTIILTISLVCYCGFAMFAYYSGCDPMKTGAITERDQLMPYFVMELMESLPGMAGLFVACLYSGTLSTVSSGVNSLAAVTLHDFVIPHWKLNSTEATVTAKILALFFGSAATGLSFLCQYLGGILSAALSTMGAINGPLAGVFLLGVLFPWANTKGVITGSIVSASFCIWLCIGAHMTNPHSGNLPTDTSQCLIVSKNLTKGFAFNETGYVPPDQLELTGLHKFYSISYALYDMIGMAIVIVVGLIVSFATGGENLEELDPRLFNPLTVRLIEYLKRRRWKSNSSTPLRPVQKLDLAKKLYEVDQLTESEANELLATERSNGVANGNVRFDPGVDGPIDQLVTRL